MKFRQVAIGGMLSVLLTVPAFSQAANDSQQGASGQDSTQSGSSNQSGDQSQAGNSQQGGGQSNGSQSQANSDQQSGNQASNSGQSQGGNSQQGSGQSQASSGQGGQNQQASSGQSQTPIKNVQAKLKSEGYYKGNVDGIWGPKSTKALEKYQKDKDIQANGQMDQQTADKLGLSQAEFSAFEQAVTQNQQRSGSQGSGQSGQSSGHQPTPHSDSSQRNFSDSP